MLKSKGIECKGFGFDQSLQMPDNMLRVELLNEKDWSEWLIISIDGEFLFIYKPKGHRGAEGTCPFELTLSCNVIANDIINH